jgi:KDO2-lipid IV(A) lauroyltransferase
MKRVGQGAVYLLFRLLLVVGGMAFAVPGFRLFLLWFFERVLRYRTKVIRSNLTLAFPEWSSTEVNKTASLFYGHFVDLLLQHREGKRKGKQDWLETVRFAPGNLLESYGEAGVSCFVVMGHTGNWEWAGLRASWVTGLQMATVYKPQRNKYITEYLVKERARFGMQQVPMKGVMRFIRASKTAYCLTFLADQSGPRDSEFYPSFFGVRTSFYGGWAKIAIRTGVPVLYAGVQKTGNKTYAVVFRMVWDGKEAILAEKLVQRYAEELELDIRRQPENWLWSHRRWKWKKQGFGKEHAKNEG